MMSFFIFDKFSKKIFLVYFFNDLPNRHHFTRSNPGTNVKFVSYLQFKVLSGGVHFPPCMNTIVEKKCAFERSSTKQKSTPSIKKKNLQEKQKQNISQIDVSKIDRLSFFASMKSIYIQRINVRYQSVLGILKITEYPNLIGQEHVYSGMSIQS